MPHDDPQDRDAIPSIPASAFRTAIRVRAGQPAWDDITPQQRAAARLSPHLPAPEPAELTVPISPDIARAFPTAQAVNDALRLLLRIRHDLQNVAP